MHFMKSSTPLEWQMANYDPFTRCFDLKLSMSDDPPMAAWFDFDWYADLAE